MKRLSIISLITAAVAFGFASCADKAEEFKKGTPDAADCYGVYFPAQKTELSLDPSEPTIDTVLVARTKTQGAITVPYVLKDDSTVFVASELKFEDGQTESYIVLTFDKAKVGTTYKCSILFDDPAYASQYTSNAIAIDITVMRDKWNDLGLATFNDWYMLGDTYKVQLLQNDKDKNKFRLMHPYDQGISAGEFGSNIGEPCEYIPMTLLQPGNKIGGVAITEDDLVYFGVSSTGYHHPSYGEDILIVHPASFSSLAAEENFLWSKVIQYQENGLPAGFQLAPYYYMNGVGGWPYYDSDPAEGDYGVKIVFPGAVLTDYSISLESGFSAMGEQDVDFYLGKDVAFAEFSAAQGALNASQIEAKVDAIIAGEDSASVVIDSTCTVTLKFPTTGQYTIVAVAYDADSVAQTYESIVVNFVAADDEVPVDVDVELISTKKYEKALGISSDNCLEYTVYGSNLTEVKVGLFPSKAFDSDPGSCLESLIGSDEAALSAEELAMVNETGLTDIFVELSPGTSYTILVYATNGYEENCVYASATTTGDPMPIYMSYSVNDLVEAEDFAPATASGFNGSYDFFAYDYFNASTSREWISTVDFEAVDDSTVLVTGMFAAEAKQYNLVDSVYFQYYDGYLFQIPTYLESAGGYTGVLNLYSSTSGKVYGWGNQLAMVGGFIDKDHIVFVDRNTGVDIDGFLLALYEDAELTTPGGYGALYYNMMFATEGLYDELLAPARSQSRVNEVAAILNTPRTNFVESEIGYIKSSIDRISSVSTISTCGKVAGIVSTPESRTVAAKVVNVKQYQKAERQFVEFDEKMINF